MTENSAADSLWALLDAEDEKVRAAAAVGLHKRQDPRALEACLRTLDDDPDLLHLDHTPAVHALIGMGKAALLGILEKMGAAEEMTRLRALRVFETLSLREFASETEWRSWWKATAYDFKQNPQENKDALTALKTWVSALE